MAIKVLIPTPLRNLTKEQDTVEANGKTIGDLIADLEKRHPGLKERLCDDKGEIRRFVNVYLNQEDIRFKEGRQTAVKDGDEVSIVPAIAGG
jgi:molybdopterin synthase sulfur carrier subunit